MPHSPRKPFDFSHKGGSSDSLWPAQDYSPSPQWSYGSAETSDSTEVSEDDEANKPTLPDKADETDQADGTDQADKTNKADGTDQADETDKAYEPYEPLEADSPSEPTAAADSAGFIEDFEDEAEDLADEEPETFWQHLTYVPRSMVHAVQRWWRGVKRWFFATRLGERMGRMNRWHWIAGTIIILSVYDVLLFFFGDTSYNIIFPKAEPIDSVEVDKKPELRFPEETTAAPKVEEQPEVVINPAEDVAPVIEEAPTSVTAEPTPAPEPPSTNKIEIPKPQIQVKPQM